MKSKPRWNRCISIGLFVVFLVCLPANTWATKSTIVPAQRVEKCRQGDNEACEKIVELIKNVQEWLTERCTETDDLEKKKPHVDQLLRLQREIDELAWIPGVEDLTLVFYDICGGIFNPDVTNIDLDPGPLQLDVGQEQQLTATIRCSNGECTGELGWYSNNPGVASITQEGVVKGESRGTTSVSAISLTFPDVVGDDAVTVGDPVIADIVFVIDNHQFNGYWFGAGDSGGSDGFRQKGQLIYDEGLNKYLDNRSRSAIVTYNNPLVFPYNTYRYYDNDEECQYWFGPGVTISNPGITDYLLFTPVSEEDPTVAAWGSLQIFCGDSDDYYYQRTSVYSALMHAMDDVSLGGWRTSDPNVKKIIILLGNHPPAGPYYPLRYRENNPEGLTGLTEDDVISRAQQQDITIHVLNFSPQDWLVEGYSGDSGYSEAMRGTFTRFAEETGGTYQETEYPQPSTSPYAGPNLYLGIVDILRQLAEDD